MKDTNHLKVLEEIEKSSLFVDFCLFSIEIINNRSQYSKS